MGEDSELAGRKAAAPRFPGALRVALLYALFSALWIVVSDAAVEMFVHDPHAVRTVSIVKGWAFVLVTAVLLYGLVVRELRRRYQVESAARPQRAILETLIQASPLAVITFDAEHRVNLWNPAAEKMFGWTWEEVYGRTLPIIPPELRDAAIDIRQRVLAGEKLSGIELERVRKDGRRISVAAWAAPLRGATGEVEHVMSILEDVTEKKRADAALRESEHQLIQAQKMEAIGRLAGGLAHDLNNLLTAVLGFAEVLQEDLPEGSLPRAHACEITKAGTRATALTRQLLAFSRKQVMEPRTFDLRAVLTDLAPMLRRLIGEDVEIVTALGTEPLPVLADPSQIEQVIVNLVVNARDAMPGGGRITIEGTLLPGTPERAADWVRLAVSDTGTGMPPDVLEHMFEPYFTTKESGKGTGLGLSTVYGIVTQSGGRITVDSAAGRGTMFELLLPPGRTSAPEPARAPLPDSEISPSRATVLVVEDEESVRRLVTATLRARGFTVQEAGNGQAALEYLRDSRQVIDLLLTDMVMPGMHGRELARHVRSACPEVRVLFMSGYAAELEAEMGPGAAFLGKPFTSRDLLNAVRDLLSGSSPV